MRLEICIDRLDSAQAAKRGGADRVEVCAALGCGGLTPSLALIEQCVALEDVVVAVMIRPHEGDFCYGPEDLTVMLRDIELAKRGGADFVVLGALTEGRRVDVMMTQRLIEAARPLEVTFHRAFDLSSCFDADLDTLIELGVDRLLTSGGRATALEGAATISRLVQRAAGNLTVVAGAGVTCDNARRIVEMTGVHELHASASEPAVSAASDSVDFGGSPRRSCETIVRGIRFAVEGEA